MLGPSRYFEATATTLEAAANDEFTCTDFSEEEQKQLEKVLPLIERLEQDFKEQAKKRVDEKS